MLKIVFVMAALIGLTLPAAPAHGEIKTREVTYKQGNATLEGYLAWDDAAAGKRPGVLVVHEWDGINDNIKKKTEELAAAGYVAFAADIYGKGLRNLAPDEAKKQAGTYRSDRKLLRARAEAGLDTLRKQKQVDGARIAAIGFCFGGTTALELARSGAPLAGVVSFHGGLSTPSAADAKNIKAKVLVLHGADDPHVKPEEVAAFEKEMRDANVDWQLVAYGGAVHAFTNPRAGGDNSKGAAYNERVAKRSWRAMQDFFGEVFAER